MKGFFKISKKDARLVLILLGGLGMLALYWFVARPYYAKTAELEAETLALLPTLAERQTHERNMPVYFAEGEEYIDLTKIELGRYPDSVTAEDWIRYAARFEDRFGVHIPALNWTESAEQVTAFDARSQRNAPVWQAQVLKAVMHCSFTAGYRDVKDFTDFIVREQGKTAIETANFSYDASTGLLMCNLQLAKYAVNNGFQAQRNPERNTGTRNPFGALR